MTHPNTELRASPDPRGGEKRPPVGADRALPGGAAGRALWGSRNRNQSNDPVPGLSRDLLDARSRLKGRDVEHTHD